jgi:hypothetical protein
VITKYIQLGGLLTLFILSLVVPGAMVLTTLQLTLMVLCALVTYQNFGDQLITFFNSLRGGNNGDRSETPASGTGSTERTSDEHAAAVPAATKTEG